MAKRDEGSIRVLSADAPKTALRALCREYSVEEDYGVSIELLTAPRIRDRVIAGKADADVIIIPEPLLRELAAAGYVEGASIAPLGSVLVGVVVRDGALEPDISSIDAFRRSIVAADVVVYNTASSGLYVAETLQRIGLEDVVSEKAKVVATGAEVMEFLAREQSNAIGFCHITEIRLHDHLGTHLVGPLPDPIGRATLYSAGAIANGPKIDRARSAIAFLTRPSSKLVFRESGVA